MISISIAFSIFPIRMLWKKKESRIFSSWSTWISAQTKRETSILQLSCYNTQETMRKKNNKCYRGEKENGSMCKNEYGGSTGEWATLSREKRARGEQQWTPFSNSTLSTNREIMYAGNNCRLKANRWIFIRGLGSLRRNNNRNSRTWPSKK